MELGTASQVPAVLPGVLSEGCALLLWKGNNQAQMCLDTWAQQRLCKPPC